MRVSILSRSSDAAARGSSIGSHQPIGAGRQYCPRPLIALLALAYFIVAPTGPALAASEEDFSTGSSSWSGYAEFARLAQKTLGVERVILKSSINYPSLHKNDALILVHPTEHLDESSLNAFLIDGGRVAVLDDFGRGEEFLRNFGLTSLPSPPRPKEKLRSDPNLPIAVPSFQVGPGSRIGRHPITAGVEQVMTNYPRVFQHPDLTPVLEIIDETGAAHTLAVTGVIAQKGRLFALGDPSIFINFMLRYPGNRKFAHGLVQYLIEPGSAMSSDGSANHLPTLYILTNDFTELGHYGKAERWQEKLDSFVDESKQSLREIGEHGFSSKLALSLSVLVALFIFVTHLKTTSRWRHLPRNSFLRLRQDHAYPRSVEPLASSVSPEVTTLNVLNELDATLREAINRRIKDDRINSPDEIANRMQAQGLPLELAQELKRLLQELAVCRTAPSLRLRTNRQSGKLLRLHQQTMRILQSIETNRATHIIPIEQS